MHTKSGLYVNLCACVTLARFFFKWVALLKKKSLKFNLRWPHSQNCHGTEYLQYYWGTSLLFQRKEMPRCVNAALWVYRSLQISCSWTTSPSLSILPPSVWMKLFVFSLIRFVHNPPNQTAQLTPVTSLYNTQPLMWLYRCLNSLDILQRQVLLAL